MNTRKSASKPVVLVVDDESALRAVLALALPRLDVDVLEAGTGPEAIEIYRRHQSNIFLVLMDVNMPGQSGPDTFEILQRINPGVRCCFMTGHLGGFRGEDLMRQGAISVIDKPFDLDELARLIQSQQMAA